MPIFKDETVAKSIKNSEGSTVEIEKGKDCKRQKLFLIKEKRTKFKEKKKKGQGKDRCRLSLKKKRRKEPKLLASTKIVKIPKRLKRKTHIVDVIIFQLGSTSILDFRKMFKLRMGRYRYQYKVTSDIKISILAKNINAYDTARDL